MAYTVEIKDHLAQMTLGVRTHSPVQDLPQVIPQTCMQVIEYIKQLGKPLSGDAFVAYYNMDMENLDVEIGFTSPDSLPAKDNIEAGSIPAGKAASVLHVGPYNKIKDAHETLHNWMEEKGYQSAGAYYELYLNDPAVTAPEALETQIFTLLKAV